MPKGSEVFLPETNYEPVFASFTAWNEQEALAHLESGWGDGQVKDLKLGYLYERVPEADE